jgi:hypothetical protein
MSSVRGTRRCAAEVTALAQALPSGQSWTQVGELGLAFLLSALIGLERELRQKPAGLRTLTIVGFAAALFMLISTYGFADVVGPDVNLDPSRIAAQVVSGLGFIGGGLVFVRRDAVRGLTTAAVVWLTAAVGMAAGAGLPLLALLVTAGHFVIVTASPRWPGGCPDGCPGCTRCGSPIGTARACCAGRWPSAPAGASPSASW